MMYVGLQVVYQVSSNHSNDYYFMWQRDASMAMRSLLRVIVDAPDHSFASVMSSSSCVDSSPGLDYEKKGPSPLLRFFFFGVRG